jgi:pimeloyl-ACP methyl ester carboxylesterase
LLLRATGGSGWIASLYDEPIVEENLLLRTRWGTFRARIYRSRDGARHHGLVLAHGVHFMGIDEPRLVVFARNLAHTGVTVMTPELAALADYRIHASSVDELRVAIRTLDDSPFVSRGGVAVMGLSFAGGLALIAAADRSMRGRVSTVVSLGGHHDLYRVSRFLATDTLETPQGERHLRAHDYGLIVYFYAHAEQFVAPDQLLVFRDALRQTLHFDRRDGERAARALTGDARVLFDQILHDDKAALRPRVLATIPVLRAEMAALSPAGHLEGLRGVDVVLMHGASDAVMPPTEAEDNARELEGVTRVHLLLSPNIKHVTVEGELSLRERWRILHTMALVLGS